MQNGNFFVEVFFEECVGDFGFFGSGWFVWGGGGLIVIWSWSWGGWSGE